MTGKSQRVAVGAYQALRDALPIVFHHKRPFANFLRASLRDAPELLATLNFEDLKRNVADAVVDRLMADESEYRDMTFQLMVEVAAMQRFPDLETQPDAPVRIRQAEAAVEEVRRWIERYSQLIAERQSLETEAAGRRERAAELRRFREELDALKLAFLELYASGDPHGRGRELQAFLADLFGLFDLGPRLEYSLEREQIDGSFSFDTDDYILEARWRNEPASREDADVFAAKVRRKGKNALGLFVSVNHFTRDALEEYREETPFIAMNGNDLFAVLDDRIRLDDLLRRKKRHANETGDCWYPAG